MIALILAAAALAPEASVALTIDPKHRLIEGLASDGVTLFASSVLDRTILACTDKCEAAFQLEGPALPLGMTWDSKRKLLWIAIHCPALPQVKPCPGEVRGVSRAGKIRYRHRLGPGFAPGDVSIAGKSVIISDSATGQIYRLDPKKGGWAALIKGGEIKSGQGTALLENGTLIAADYSKGVSRISLKSGDRTILLRDDGKPLRGIDGMVADRINVYGIYNGQNPGKLLYLRMYGDTLRFDDLGDIPDPTQLAVQGPWVFAVTNSGWASIDQNDARSQGAQIVRFMAVVWD